MIGYLLCWVGIYLPDKVGADGGIKVGYFAFHGETLIANGSPKGVRSEVVYWLDSEFICELPFILEDTNVVYLRERRRGVPKATQSASAFPEGDSTPKVIVTSCPA